MGNPQKRRGPDLSLDLQKMLIETSKRRRSSVAADVPMLKEIFSNKKKKLEEHDFYKVNSGREALMPMLPDPPCKMPMAKHITYTSEDEPKFDPNIHLKLEKPAHVAIFDGDDFKTMKSY